MVVQTMPNKSLRPIGLATAYHPIELAAARQSKHSKKPLASKIKIVCDRPGEVSKSKSSNISNISSNININSNNSSSNSSISASLYSSRANNSNISINSSSSRQDVPPRRIEVNGERSVRSLEDEVQRRRSEDEDGAEEELPLYGLREPVKKRKDIVITYQFRISPAFVIFLCLAVAYFGGIDLRSFRRTSETCRTGLTAQELQIQEESRLLALQKFGPGPHFVRLELDFDHSDDNDEEAWMLIKLASLEEMPHSVYTFLEMVSLGLWDGCSFGINGGHVVMASPAEYKGSHASRTPAFRRAGFAAPRFPEYSPSHPHEAFTLGFVGTLSGPEFYINTMDNSDIHGPGAQQHHADQHHADPCFGRIVSGQQLVQRITQVPLDNGVWLSKPVGIRSAKITTAP